MVSSVLAFHRILFLMHREVSMIMAAVSQLENGEMERMLMCSVVGPL